MISKSSCTGAELAAISQGGKETRKMNSVLLLSFLWTIAAADIYMHNPR